MIEKLEQFAQAVEVEQRKQLTEWAERNEEKGAEARAAFIAKLAEREAMRSGGFSYTAGWDASGVIAAEVRTEMALDILKGMEHVGQEIEGGWRGGQLYTWAVFLTDVEDSLATKIERGTSVSRGGNVMSNAVEQSQGEAAFRVSREIAQILKQGERDARSSYCQPEREHLRLLRKERGEVGELWNRARSDAKKAQYLTRTQELDAEIIAAEAGLERALDAAGANGAEGLFRSAEKAVA